ncbi:MAG: hypothetical protein HYU51_19020 [Candidatus Rokubacteria bacterium]|nr:hypothetical protein [Candidatus Rokubacteria bacterium]
MLVLSLPPLDRDDHVIDAGAGTGKLAGLVARAYPRLGRLTLVEPNADKLDRARRRLIEILPGARVETLAAGLGDKATLPRADATAVIVVTPRARSRGPASRRRPRSSAAAR